MLFKKNSVIVLQGDSITDAGRRKPGNPEHGVGYAAMVINTLKSLYPDYDLTMYNRGIGGNRVADLKDRWDVDCLDLDPSLVSILVGINDVWHYRTGSAEFDLVKLEEDYIEIVERTVKSGAKLIIMEPFVFHHDAFKEQWRADLWKVVQVIRNIAVRYADAYIPLDGMFYERALTTPAATLSADGVHPTSEGHRLIADAWLKAAIEK